MLRGGCSQARYTSRGIAFPALASRPVTSRRQRLHHACVEEPSPIGLLRCLRRGSLTDGERPHQGEKIDKFGTLRSHFAPATTKLRGCLTGVAAACGASHNYTESLKFSKTSGTDAAEPRAMGICATPVREMPMSWGLARSAVVRSGVAIGKYPFRAAPAPAPDGSSPVRAVLFRDGAMEEPVPRDRKVSLRRRPCSKQAGSSAGSGAGSGDRPTGFLTPTGRSAIDHRPAGA